MQPLCSLFTIYCDYKLSELVLSEVACLAESGETMRSIILDSMIDELGPVIKPLLKVPNE